MDECSEVAKWFNNHSFALGKFDEEQKDIYKGKVRALVTPGVTRWTASGKLHAPLSAALGALALREAALDCSRFESNHFILLSL
jgi:hypothetical protein